MPPDESKKGPRLATGDKELLEVAATGKSLIELTPEMLDAIGRSLEAREADIEERYPKLVAECAYV